VFYQLIEGLLYFRTEGIGHLDITDFDTALKQEDLLTCKPKGTINYQAPEILKECCKDGQTADIYAADITLFCLITGNCLIWRAQMSKGSICII
jgi:serine/threonine protein kinase